jgi:hypothetical protein
LVEVVDCGHCCQANKGRALLPLTTYKGSALLPFTTNKGSSLLPLTTNKGSALLPLTTYISAGWFLDGRNGVER